MKKLFIISLVFLLTGCLGGITYVKQTRYYFVTQCTETGDNTIDAEVLVDKEIPLSPRQETHTDANVDASVVPKRKGILP